jgi:hypothetical protein
MWRVELPEHGGCRSRVRWCHDSAERHCCGPGECGHRPAGNHGNCCHGETHSYQSKGRDCPPMTLQIARRSVVGGIQKDRSHEESQRELGIERDAGHIGEERQARATQREQCGVGNFQPAGPSRKHRAHQKQCDD